MPVPSLKRTSGDRAILLADKAEYALGIASDSDEAKVVRRHQLFIAEVRDCYAATGDPLVHAVLRYLEEPHRPIPWENFDPTLIYSFRVDGKYPFASQAVQAYWAQKVIGGDVGSENQLVGESLISGKVGPIMDREPVKIKGIPDGQTSGMVFISANASAFLSYGLEDSQNAPVLKSEAEQYANALNALLADKKTHLRIGNVVYAFWTKEGDNPPIAEVLQGPAPEEEDFFGSDSPVKFASRPEKVRSALYQLWSGGNQYELRKTDFFAVSLSASGSRVAVRNHIISTVEDVMGRLTDFLQAQVVRDKHRSLGIFSLATAMYRDIRKDRSGRDLDALVAYALGGRPLPFQFLQRLIGRNRAEQRVTHPRAALTRMTLISRGVINMSQLSELDMSFPSVAYQLGRLLAALDDVQTSVMAANTTLVDRFYGAMSTTPRSVMGRLLQGSQHHLASLRKDKPGIYFSKQQMLEEINSRIKPQEIPAVFNLEQQALFGLGYYHQRAAISARIASAAKAKESRQPTLIESQGEQA